MKKTGNLFEVAREQLEKERIEKNELEFTFSDVIDRAVEIRKRLDEQEVRKHNKSNKKWYSKKRGIKWKSLV